MVPLAHNFVAHLSVKVSVRDNYIIWYGYVSQTRWKIDLKSDNSKHNRNVSEITVLRMWSPVSEICRDSSNMFNAIYYNLKTSSGRMDEKQKAGKVNFHLYTLTFLSICWPMSNQGSCWFCVAGWYCWLWGDGLFFLRTGCDQAEPGSGLRRIHA